MKANSFMDKYGYGKNHCTLKRSFKDTE